MTLKNEPPQKIMGLWDSVAVIVGIVIGVGIFKTPAVVAGHLPAPVWIFFAWLAGGIISLAGAFCYAEFAVLFPRTGGNYVYLKESYGRLTGFLYAWAELLFIRPGSIAAVAFIFAEIARSFFSLDVQLLKPVAVLAILILTASNALGLKFGKNIQNFLAAVLFILIGGTILSAFFSQQGAFINFTRNELSAPLVPCLRAFFLALVPILWTYGGWHENTFLAGETKNASRVIPKALIVALVIIISLYFGINAAYIYLIPIPEIAASPLVMSRLMFILFGTNGERLVETLIMLAALASMNGTLITGSRIGYAWIEEGLQISKTRRQGRAYSVNAVLFFVGLLSALMVVFGTFERLLFFTGIFVWLFFGMTAAGLLLLRRKYAPLGHRKSIFYPVVPLLFIAACGALLINTFLTFPGQSTIGLFLLLPAFMVHIFVERKNKHSVNSGHHGDTPKQPM